MISTIAEWLTWFHYHHALTSPLHTDRRMNRWLDGWMDGRTTNKIINAEGSFYAIQAALFCFHSFIRYGMDAW